MDVKIIHLSDYENRSPTCHYFDIEAIRASSHKSTEVYGEDQREAQLKPYTPKRFDFAKLLDDLKSYGAEINSEKDIGGKQVTKPHCLPVKFKNLNLIPPTVIIVEGLYALYNEKLNELASMKVFVDLDGDTRLGRWILHEAKENNAVFVALCNEYINYCRPEMDNYIYKTKESADIILPQGNEPESVKLVSNGIHDKVAGEFMEYISKKHLDSLRDNIQSPIYVSLTHSDIPPLLDLAEEVKTEQYYDVN